MALHLAKSIASTLGSSLPILALPGKVQTTMDEVKKRVPNARSYVRSAVLRLITSILPNHFRRIHARTTRPQRPTTAYLDGLRGLATLGTVIYAFTNAVDSRWVWGSGFSVPLYCVITGYALSHRPLHHLRDENWNGLLSAISSSSFRRGLRIFIPPLISSFLVVIMLRLNLYELARTAEFQKFSIERLPTMHEQVLHWWSGFYKFSVLGSFGLDNRAFTYSPALRTIPIVFRGSLILYLTTAGLAYCQERFRLLLELFFILLCYRYDQLEILGLFGGMLICELDLRRRDRSLCTTSEDMKLRRGVDWIGNLINALAFVIGAVLMSQPTICTKTCSFFQLCWLEPKSAASHYIGAVIILWAAGRSITLQNLFNHAVLKYLGTISYSIYLVHGPLVQVVGYRMTFHLVQKDRSSMRDNLSIAICNVLNLLIIICISDVFWRCVERPSQDFALWLQKLCNVNNSVTTPVLEPAPILERQISRQSSISKSEDISIWIKEQHLPTTEASAHQSPERRRCNLRRITPKRILWFLLPSFVQDPTFEPQRRLKTTAWLDGMRGYASVFFVFYHLVYAFHSQEKYNIGYGYDKNNMHVMQLPILRLIYSGNVMISIFFIVSGYLLSVKPLQQIRSSISNNNESTQSKLFQTLSSSIFKRAPQLLIPALISTFINMLLVQLRIFQLTGKTANDKSIIIGFQEYHIPNLSSLIYQFINWIQQSESMIKPFQWDNVNNQYNPHLWTIPLEFSNSLLMYLYLLIFSQAHSPIRLLSLTTFTTCAYYLKLWSTVLFLSGVLIAEINLIQDSHPWFQNWKHRHTSSHKTTIKTTIISTTNRRIFCVTLYIFSLFLSSQPILHTSSTPGYQTLTTIIFPNLNPNTLPQLGTFLLIFTTSQSSDLQKIYTTPFFSSYLSKISYSIYLCHYSIIHTVGYIIIPYFIRSFGGFEKRESGIDGEGRFIPGSDVGWELGWFVGCGFTVVIVFGGADLFWRGVKWLGGWLRGALERCGLVWFVGEVDRGFSGKGKGKG